MGIQGQPLWCGTSAGCSNLTYIFLSLQNNNAIIQIIPRKTCIQSMKNKFVEEVFGVGGYFSKAIGEKYEIRQQQADLAATIDGSLGTKEGLIAEAPCGTGKSYAYLVPAIKHAIENNQKVVIATANIALQEQLVTKDLPDLQKIMPYDFTYSLVKGRGNYICKDKADDARLRRDFHTAKWGKEKKDSFMEVLKWADVSDNGDKSELSFDPSSDMWELVSVQDNDCKKKSCAFYETCFSNMARRKAAEAHVIVCNYHVVLLDADIKAKTNGFGGILPEYTNLICDEGHRLEEIARNFFGADVTNISYRRVAAILERSGKDALPHLEKETKKIAEQIRHENARFFDEVYGYYKKQGSQYLRTKEKGIADYTELVKLIKRAAIIIDDAATVLENKDSDEVELYRSRATEARDMAEKIKMIIDQSHEEATAYWIEAKENQLGLFVKLVGRPIYIKTYLHNLLWAKMSSVNLVSATMAVPTGVANSNPFEFMIQSLGLKKNILTFNCDSPFDHELQSMLVVPESIPSPKNEFEYRKAFLQQVQDAILAAQGRTLVLFTSYSHLNYFYDNCHKVKKKYTVLAQGDGKLNRMDMIKKFKEDNHSVLLGTSSFWEGIDVQGDALSLLVVDRLPFTNPKQDPILDALSELMDYNTFFNEEYIPRAIIKLKQGVGRLIRSKEDKGVVLIADTRILPGNAKYAHRFLEALPKMNGSTNIDDVAKFLS